MKGPGRIKRSTKQYIIVSIISIVVMGGAAMFTAFLISEQVKEKYAILLADARQEMEDNKRTVYVATNDIMTGEYLTKENVTLQTIYATQPVETYILEEDIGKVALVDIIAGTQVLKDMLTEKTISSELRELEYSVIIISTNIASNDTVDVRLSYPNGESYVVLSKKILKGYTPEMATCFFWMDEEEILRMSAAIVDVGLYTGSCLYVTKYIEPNIQEASVINYTPSLSILTLMESDPNILERVTQELSKQVRKSLENRLADSLTTDVSSISWNVNQNILVNPTPTPIPPLTQENTLEQDTVTRPVDIDNSGEERELGSTKTSEEYFYFAESEKAEEGDIEYGE